MEGSNVCLLAVHIHNHIYIYIYLIGRIGVLQPLVRLTGKVSNFPADNPRVCLSNLFRESLDPARGGIIDEPADIAQLPMRPLPDRKYESSFRYKEGVSLAHRHVYHPSSLLLGIRKRKQQQKLLAFHLGFCYNVILVGAVLQGQP